MKRFAQLAVLLAVTLLAAQPAFAGLPCADQATRAGGCAPGCGMAMSPMPDNMPMSRASSPMSSDCPMTPQITSDGCAQNCCQETLPLSNAQLSQGTKLSADLAVQLVPAASAIAIATPFRADAPLPVFDSAPPPLYLLLQVFRI